jgi:hypothetical protein
MADGATGGATFLKAEVRRGQHARALEDDLTLDL